MHHLQRIIAKVTREAAYPAYVAAKDAIEASLSSEEIANAVIGEYAPHTVVPTDDSPCLTNVEDAPPPVVRRLFTEEGPSPTPVVHNIGLFNPDGTQQTNRERRLARQANARSRTYTVESVGAPSTVESVGAPDPPGDRCAIQIEDYDSLHVSS